MPVTQPPRHDLLMVEYENLQLSWLENDIVEGISKDLAQEMVHKIKSLKEAPPFAILQPSSFNGNVCYDAMFHLSMSFLHKEEAERIIAFMSKIGLVTNQEINLPGLNPPILRVSFYASNHLYVESGSCHSVATKITNALIKELGILYPDFKITFQMRQEPKGYFSTW